MTRSGCVEFQGDKWVITRTAWKELTGLIPDAHEKQMIKGNHFRFIFFQPEQDKKKRNALHVSVERVRIAIFPGVAEPRRDSAGKPLVHKSGIPVEK